jgi:hypothetical protein
MDIGYADVRDTSGKLDSGETSGQSSDGGTPNAGEDDESTRAGAHANKILDSLEGGEQDALGDGDVHARLENTYRDTADSRLGYDDAERTQHQHAHAFEQRPDVFAKDLTVRVPAGTYGWWPISMVIPPLSVSNFESGNRHTRASTARTATLFVLMRGASGTLWLDDFKLSPLRNSESDTRKAGHTAEALPLHLVPKLSDSALDTANANAPLRMEAHHAQLTETHDQVAPALTADHFVGRHGAITVKRFHKKARQPADMGAVTLVTQLTLERFAALKAQLRAWRSFMSVAVLVGADGHELLQLEEWWDKDDEARNKVRSCAVVVSFVLFCLFVENERV